MKLPRRVCAFAMLVCACSDGSQSADGIDRSAKFAEVSENQPDALCREVERLRHDDAVYVSRLCTVLGATSAEIEGGTCAEQRAACSDDLPTQCEFSDIEDVDCPEATVGMFLDCMQGSVRRIKELYADVTCDTPATEVIDLLSDTAEELNRSPPPECEDFQRSCPAFFEAADPSS
jgi:hypothetical protein